MPAKMKKMNMASSVGRGSIPGPTSRHACHVTGGSWVRSRPVPFRNQRALARAEPSSSASKFGVVLVDHGSKKKESNDMLETFADMYRKASGRDLVEVAHMEIAEPTIPQALERCVEYGATKVVVAPYFLSPGRHIQKDIPRIVGEAAKKFPGVDIEIADPIGLDPLVAQVIENRVRAKE